MLYLLIIVIGGIASLFMPWWIIAPVCFGLCFWLAKNAATAFGVAAAAVTTLWMTYALFLLFTSEVNLLPKVTGLITANVGFLSNLPTAGIGFTIMGFIALLVGGFSGLAGYQVAQVFDPKRR